MWEPACGSGHIVNYLLKNDFDVIYSDISEGKDFLKEWDYGHTIVTNPPFSLKKEFYRHCMELGRPWALLIPVEFSGFILDAMKQGCQWIIPTRRIDYITPNICELVFQNTLLESCVKMFKLGKKTKFDDLTDEQMAECAPFAYNYDAPGLVPDWLIAKYSHSQFHSGWLTFGLNLPKQINVVELSLKDKKNVQGVI